MIKQFTRFQVASLKRTMKNIAPLMRKRGSLEKKAQEILVELKEIDSQIEAYKELLEPITGGIDPELIIACGGSIEVPDMPEIPTETEIEMEPFAEEA